MIVFVTDFVTKKHPGYVCIDHGCRFEISTAVPPAESGQQPSLYRARRLLTAVATAAIVATREETLPRPPDSGAELCWCSSLTPPSSEELESVPLDGPSSIVPAPMTSSGVGANAGQSKEAQKRRLFQWLGVDVLMPRIAVTVF
eukprot:jgi/Picsp_1/5436/NSC_02795-R1_---NA---